jgi:acylphosphatase
MNDRPTGYQGPVSAHLIVSGYVQGVGYRWFVMRKAEEYKLKGYVRNLYSGDVEVEVEGYKPMIIDFVKELKVGPRSAQVIDVRIRWGECENKYKKFDVKF